MCANHEDSSMTLNGATTPDDCRAACANATKDPANGIVMVANQDRTGSLGTEGSSALTWGAAATWFLPRVTTGGTWCAAWSFKDTGTTCKLKMKNAADLTATTNIPGGITGTWEVADGSEGGDCYNVVSNSAENTVAVGGTSAPEILNFVTIVNQMPAAYNAAKNDATVYTEMVTDAKTQAGLETAWLQAYYYKQYWLAIKDRLTTSTTGSTCKLYSDYHATVSAETGTETDAESTWKTWETHGANLLKGATATKLQVARDQLAFKQVDIALKQAHVDLLGRQLNRVQEQLDELDRLTKEEVKDSNDVVTTAAGELAAARDKRLATYNLYAAADGDLSVSAAETAMNAAIAAVVLQGAGTEGQLALDRRTADEEWTSAKNDVTTALNNITTEEDGTTLASLR